MREHRHADGVRRRLALVAQRYEALGEPPISANHQVIDPDLESACRSRAASARPDSAAKALPASADAIGLVEEASVSGQRFHSNVAAGRSSAVESWHASLLRVIRAVSSPGPRTPWQICVSAQTGSGASSSSAVPDLRGSAFDPCRPRRPPTSLQSSSSSPISTCRLVKHSGGQNRIVLGAARQQQAARDETPGR